MSYTITLLPGDGIGPEVSEATTTIIEAAGVSVHWDRQMAGVEAVEAGRDTIPDETLNSIQSHRVALKGPITTPVGRGFRSVNVGLRKLLNLYTSLRPVRTLPGITTRHDNVDLIVFRENTEGLYSGREHEIVPGVIGALKIMTDEASERIARYAFEYARFEGRKKVTVVHKATIMKLSDGLFLDACHRVAEDYPFIETDDVLIDNAAMGLVLDPTHYDVLLMENLYGDIISDLCAGLVGGLGVVPGANIGDKCAVFEAVHGSAPDIAGQGIANPIALILSGCLMLRHIGERNTADRIEFAVGQVLENGQVRTGDLGGTATTAEMTRAIIDALPQEIPA